MMQPQLQVITSSWMGAIVDIEPNYLYDKDYNVINVNFALGKEDIFESCNL